MSTVIAGATITVAADLGPNRAPFILDRDLLDAPTSLLTEGAATLIDLTVKVASLDGSWGATDWAGALTVPDAGELTAAVYDPDRAYDPANPANTDPYPIGRAFTVSVDGQPIFTGTTVLVGHNMADLVTTFQVVDAITDASSAGLVRILGAGTTEDQALSLMSGAGWGGRFTTEGGFAASRSAETYEGTLWDGWQRIATAEAGQLYVTRAGVIMFRGRGNAPDPAIGATVGPPPNIPIANLGTSIDDRIVNKVAIANVGGTTVVYTDAQSIASFGEHVLDADANELLLT